MRLGRNSGGYFGETIDVMQVVRETVGAARRHGWRIEILPVMKGVELTALTRPPARSNSWAPRIYLSSGIHGDEPAGPLAIQRLFHEQVFPDQAWLWCCPCLNPTGFQRNTRASAAGVDLNRDYRHLRTPEVRAHIAWLQRQPMFDLCLCLHEDWEAHGFYVYELNPAQQPSLAGIMTEAVRESCPIDPSPLIDGREAQDGIICPNLDPAGRPEWPEALYLIQNKTRLSYTLEAPSDFPLEARVCALTSATRAALNACVESAARQDATKTAAPPP
jgi:hypothetical protein